MFKIKYTSTGLFFTFRFVIDQTVDLLAEEKTGNFHVYTEPRPCCLNPDSDLL